MSKAVTDNIPMPRSRLQIQQGLEQIRCLRLSEKGLYRWYAGCGNTPIAIAWRLGYR